MRTRVKICGVTRVQDALEAVKQGVDAIGLVFYAPSPRNVSPAQAAEIVSKIPAFVTVVGLFVDAEPAFIREIMVAARSGGADLSANPRLRLAIEKAKAVNLPADTVKRNIDKATGQLEGVHYEEIRYEGYGIGGVAIIIDTMTDNKVRTVAEVRHVLSKGGGNLGTEGSVAFQFKHCGQMIFAPGTSEEKLMDAALEAGAEDILTEADGATEVITAAQDFEAVKNSLQAAGLTPEVAEVTMRAESMIELTGDDALKMQKILDALEDLDDVQEVYHNAALDL